ncbi:FixH family protein [Paenibacillus sp. FSL R7-0331]|uniref:FixH family protein n=1 Tax=Paenibacillus sp. FSL R7-0331 TaxID=1536773 RepID=UPI0004F7A15D|nr:FixH family protein [Paenibacillus sp. FSL R7-0331]AIQ53086.1 hypothetical protein R70331_17175 [Paenibacillus sp. FSL R7-0331]
MIRPKQLAAALSVIAVVSLAGCSSNRMEHNHMHAAANASMEPIQVELSWSPQQAKAGEPVTFQAAVTQAGEAVEDAREVLFEVVSSEDETVKVEVKGVSAGDGVYEAEWTFEEDGEYKVTSHVTARTQHSMPGKMLTVQP